MDIVRPIFLPALRGEFGNWVYYAGTMPLSEVKERIGFARELHQNARLGKH